MTQNSNTKDTEMIARFIESMDRYYLPEKTRVEIVEIIEAGSWDLDLPGFSIKQELGDRELCLFLADRYEDLMAGADGWE